MDMPPGLPAMAMVDDPVVLGFGNDDLWVAPAPGTGTPPAAIRSAVGVRQSDQIIERSHRPGAEPARRHVRLQSR